MSKAKKTHAQTDVFVRGRGEFPIDMLRYDNCVPAGSSDAALIQGDWHGGGASERIVHLHRYSQDGSAPTVARWRSFGWGVYAASELPAAEAETRRVREAAVQTAPSTCQTPDDAATCPRCRATDIARAAEYGSASQTAGTEENLK